VSIFEVADPPLIWDGLSYQTQPRDEIPIISVAAVAYVVDCFEPSPP